MKKFLFAVMLTALTAFPLAAQQPPTPPVAVSPPIQALSGPTLFVPALTCATGTINAQAGAGRYYRAASTTNKLVWVSMSVSVSDIGTCSSTVSISLPFTSTAAPGIYLLGQNASNGTFLVARIFAGINAAPIFNTTGIITLANGDNLIFSGWYEEAQ